MLTGTTTILGISRLGSCLVVQRQPCSVVRPLISCSRLLRTAGKSAEVVSAWADPDKKTPRPRELEARGPRRIKVAVVGVPNSGKSTLINQILNRRVFSVSKKVHTTIHNSRAPCVEGDTQIVFVDTPGLVTLREAKRHSLQPSFLKDAVAGLHEANLVAVMHDVSNKWTRDKLDPKVLRLLDLAPDKPAVLVLNKVDTLRSKRLLLDLVQKLTGGTLRPLEQWSSAQHSSQLLEQETQHGMKKFDCGYWKNFFDVFMISALDGTGVDEMKAFMVRQAQPGEWTFPEDAFTDESPQEIAEMAVREKMLEQLPNEVPYNITTQLEMFEDGHTGVLCISVLATCPTKRCAQTLLGTGGKNVKSIAEAAEVALADTFKRPVRLIIKCIFRDK